MADATDANQEAKKDSKAKKTALDVLEGILIALIVYYYGVFGGLVLIIPIGTIIFLARLYGDKKIELISVILSYVFFILFTIWFMFYVTYLIDKICPYS